MNRFKFWNTGIGWLSFIIVAIVYLLTIEPTMSLWDCGEFIASSYKLEVGHPPGAPFFILMAKVFSLLTSEPSKVAMMVNAFSAIASAFTILFLFWTITHLAGKLLFSDKKYADLDIILTLGAGFIGAMAYTFSDSFWFSAVEGEVYATSSLFTAVVFWAILKWENVAHEKYANRWLILIAYLMGLSIGVHLLNLLAIPAIVLVYYSKMYKPSVKGFFIAVLVSFAILGFVQYGLIAGAIKLASLVELLFVNRFGLPFNSGAYFYGIVLFVSLIFGIIYTGKKGKVLANTIVLAIAMILLGYSTYALILIRSNANTPLNENNPKDVFSLLYYLNREQYGNRPLIEGQYYNAPVLYTKNGAPNYVRIKNKYIVANYKIDYVFDSRFTTFLPRMYSSDPSHVRVYKEWAKIKGKPLTVKRDDKQEIEYKPSFIDNLEFFVKYQIGYMYFRYFMWNFAGKQNDVQGNGGILFGNWISGIPFIDNYFYGPQQMLPTYLKENRGRNTYYLLPLLLGILGLVYQFRKNRYGFWIVSFLFFMTGIAIVLYLNQTPLQPRERDYAYSGSFYAFTIWVGLGVVGLAGLCKRFISFKTAVYASIVASLTVPVVLAVQNWDDHDRSGRYIARDIAYNYLNSCAPNAILFTNGDNDTFPLWYLQEVEGIRTDVRVVNLMLLGTDWYINQMNQPVYNAKPVPMSLTGDKIRKGKRDVVYFVEKNKGYIDLKNALKFVESDNDSNKYISESGEAIDYFAGKNFILPVDSVNVLHNGTVKYGDNFEPVVSFRMNKGYVLKSELMVMDILAQNNWERPIYFTSPSQSNTLGLQRYLRLEGFAYRLTPNPAGGSENLEPGFVESTIMYDNFMNRFRWGNMDDPHVLIDNHYLRTFSILRFKLNFARLAKQLALEGKRDSAINVINKCMELSPSNIIPPDIYSFKFAESCYISGAIEQGDNVLMDYGKRCIEELHFYHSLPPRLSYVIGVEKAIAEQSLERVRNIAKENKRDIVIENLLTFDETISN